MKPKSLPHDPLDDLLAAAVHGELTTAQRAELDSLLQNDPAARAAYQEIQTMHDLLERNHKDVRPDESFEERMISAVRRKARAEKAHRETMWESAVVLWHAVKWPLTTARPRRALVYGLAIVAMIAVVAGVALGPITSGIRSTGAANYKSRDIDLAAVEKSKSTWASQPGNVQAFQTQKNLAKQEDLKTKLASNRDEQSILFRATKANQGQQQATAEITTRAGDDVVTADNEKRGADLEAYVPPAPMVTTQNGMQKRTEVVREYPIPQSFEKPKLGNTDVAFATTTTPSSVMFGRLPTGEAAQNKNLRDLTKRRGINYAETAQKGVTLSGYVDPSYTYQFDGVAEHGKSDSGKPAAISPTADQTTPSNPPASVATQAPSDFKRRDVGVRVADGLLPDSIDSLTSGGNSPAPAQPASKPGAQTTTSTDAVRKLVRDAKLDLEVKSFQKTVDAITAQAKVNGGYVDSSNSQRGGNGKLQGMVVVKVLPENLDAFLLKLRDLGEIKNQSVSTEDVTKDYFDTQARLTNSQHMESQLQLLLAHTNGKVSDLLQVERELGRVRGEIEQMQGQLKLYDFQVEYATITINVAEKDLNQSAAYLLEEHDQFSLFVRNVEDAFTQSKAAADTFKAQILNANLQHNSGNSISATLAFSVPPDQIDGFLDRVKSLGRVDNFTRVTQRVANDGGDAAQPSDQARTDKDRVQVQLAIRADDESPRQQTQLVIASTGDIDAQAQQLKDDAAKYGATVTASSFEHAPDGTETAAISFRLPLVKVGDFMPVLEKLGRVEALTVQRNDRADQPAADPGAPAEIDLRLHNVAAVSLENETPRQATQLAIVSSGDVDAQAQQLKSDALKSGVSVTASTFERQPDGTEQAALTFRLPMTQAAAFTDTLKKLGRVESFAVQRNDVSGPNSTDPNAPAEISLTLRNEPALVAEDRGFWPTVRHMFGGGAEAFLGSVQVIGVLFAFVLPWVVAIAAAAWVGRRIYVAYRGRKAA